MPVNAIIQHRPDADKKGKVIATAALLSWVGILLASGVYFLLTVPFHLKSPQIFLFGALLSLAGTIYCVKLMPDSLLRFVLWLLTRTLYRIRVDGRDNIPEKGGALFVCNHVSLVDALLLIASTDRQIRFLMFKDIYEQRWINWGARILGVIPDFVRTTPARNASSRCKPRATPSATARSCAFLPRARSRASGSCCRSGAAWSAS